MQYSLNLLSILKRWGITACWLVCLCVGSGNLWAQSAVSVEPHEQLLSFVKALRNNDWSAVLDVAVPQKERDALREQWNVVREHPATDEDREGFRQVVQTLTAPGAEDVLMQQLHPLLSQWRASLPQMLPTFETLIVMSIQNSQEIQPELKAQAADFVRAMGNWARETDITSPELAQQAVNELVRFARSTNISSIDDIKALEFEQLLDHAGSAMATSKHILGVYGIAVDDVLDTIEAETLTQSDGKARVRIGMQFLGELVEVQTDMVYVDEQWISSETQSVLEGAHAAAEISTQSSVTASAASADLQTDSGSGAAHSGLASGSEPDLAGMHPARVYLAYRSALVDAKAIQDIQPYWGSWMATSAETIEANDRQRKLAQLKESATQIHIVHEHRDDGVHHLVVSAVDANGVQLQGNVNLREEEGRWRIDEEVYRPIAGPITVAPVDMAIVPSALSEDRPVADPGQQPDKGSDDTDGDSLSAVQAQLDKNPFLKRHKIKMTATEMADGFLSLEMRAGPETLREQIAAGYDVVDGDPQSLVSDKDRQAVLAINKVAKVLTKKHQLEAILVSVP